jgi:hypothetical protein
MEVKSKRQGTREAPFMARLESARSRLKEGSQPSMLDHQWVGKALSADWMRPLRLRH